jgi:DNA-binding MarR family transcriptional regulator
MSAPSLTSMARLSGLFRREFTERLAQEDWVAEAKVRMPAYGTLVVISERGPISQKELADLVGLHPSDVVDLIDQLEANGWVSRDRDPTDRRRYRLTLTNDGRAALARFDLVVRAAEDAVLASLTSAERVTLSRLIDKVLAAQQV